jgi:hypothetical protein
MIRRLLNLVTLLSLLLSLGSAAMWVRSQDVTEAWDFNPRPTADPVPPGLNRWERYRSIESARGHVAYAQWAEGISVPWPIRFMGGGYSQPAMELSPARFGRSGSRLHVPASTVHHRIPGVLDWWAVPAVATVGATCYVEVPWLTLAVAGAVTPALRGWRRWRRPPVAARGPAFPVAAAAAPSPKPVIP